ncbi:autotransporter outer membrane beta-barrel domain-containing protein [Fusobacterium ulcerans]|uniref:autotransporter family protein n=1 Tax=Fusobacterium ulcerans TaxID=861 RepID=UPI00309F0736
MIEKLMKAVKSNNKKRGRNITVGAVVGFLLSCTAVMGADNNYLWIKNDAGTTKFNIKDSDNVNNWNEKNPYEENEWKENTYINNMILTGIDNNSYEEWGTKIVDGYGLKLSGDLGELNFINNGIINGSGKDSGYGIKVLNSSINGITNNGTISGISTTSGNSGSYGYGIIIENSVANSDINIGDIKNYGIVSGSSSNYSYGHGIKLTASDLKSKLTVAGIRNKGIISNYESLIGYGILIGRTSINNGILNDGIISSSSENDGYGILIDNLYMSRELKVGGIINTGIISASNSNYSYGMQVDNSMIEGEGIINRGIINASSKNSSYGIRLRESKSKIKGIVNSGIIYGKTYAIYRVDGTISGASNYGILANGDSSKNVYSGMNLGSDLAENTLVNYGLIIKNGTIEKVGNYNQPLTVSFGNENREMTIENKESGSVTGNRTNHILNGLTETYKAINGDNKVTDSIINAYQTAVAFDTAGGKLTLSGTAVNGGIDGTSAAISGSDDSSKTDTLVLENSVVNGNIDMKKGNDVLTIGNGTTINGTMDGGADDDTINFGTSSNARAGSGIDDNINIQHNISGFENININTNVTVFESTVFESTVDSKGKPEDLKITGVNKVTIGETGVLNLRLKVLGTINVNNEEISKTGHAFLGNSMIIQGEGNGVDIAGTLRFVTNEIGKKIYVDMKDIELKNLYIKNSSVIDGYKVIDKEGIILAAYKNINEIYKPENTEVVLSGNRYDSLNNIYKGIYSSKPENLNALRTLISFDNFGNNYDENMSDEVQFKNLLTYLNSVYTETPYSYSSELSRRSAGMFRDIVTENQFRPDLDKWLIMGGLTHADGGSKDTYYGKNYHEFDTSTSDIDVDMKLTGAYALGKYGYSENISLGVTAGGNKSEAELSMSKVKGSSGYIGAFAENYRGNLTLKAGAGIQYSEYDADRRTIGGHSYNEKYSDMTYDIYLNGRYSHNIGENLFLEPYGTLSYTYIDQDGADEGSKALAIETDSKSFDYTTAKMGVDLKKVIPHEKGKSTLSAGVSYTKILDGADEEYITGRFKGGSDFDILVAHKNEHSIGLNAKYALELENGILFDVKGTYSVERDSHNQSGKNKTKGEWIVGTGLGYKF